MNKILEAALRYRNHYKFSVIPVGQDKKPLIEWKTYQEKMADDGEIKDWFKQWPDANIGIVTGSISNVCVVDIDTPEGDKAFNAMMPESLITPMAHTPKGGKHYFFRCEGKYPGNNARSLEGCDFRGEGGYVVAWPSVNGNGKGWVWDSALNPKDNKIAFLFKEYISFVFNCNKHATQSYNSLHVLQSVTLFKEGRRDDDLFHVANCLIKGGMREETATQVLNILGESCKPQFPQDELKNKIQSAIKRSERRERNLAEEVREYISVTQGYFSVTESYRELHCVTKQEKTAVRVSFHRLSEQGVLEKHRSKNGFYRLIEEDCEPINFLDATAKPLDLLFPLGVEAYSQVMPGNICIISGASNAGKTGYLLSFTEMNMEKYDIYYFSSEMLQGEMKVRLSFFNRDLKSWTFKPYHRTANFADVIKPDAINIIDFLELGGDGMEFYKVGAFIKEIFDKLNTGIAFIALQKNIGKDVKYAVGGQRSLEKARLYLSLDFNRLEIIKGKNRTDYRINPDGMFCKFRLEKGCNFIKEASWSIE